MTHLAPENRTHGHRREGRSAAATVVAPAGVPTRRASPRLTLVDGPEAECEIRVLIAEGQALVRGGFRALLERDARITVVGEAATGEEAVALARRFRPDVLLIDARLPGLDCVEVTGVVASETGARVMLLTSSEGDDRVFAALRAGASGLLVKDTEPRDSYAPSTRWHEARRCCPRAVDGGSSPSLRPARCRSARANSSSLI